MKKALLLCSLAICSLLAQAQFPYTGTIAATDPTFHRPDQGAPPTMLSLQGVGVYYNVIEYIVTTTGMVTITCTSSNHDFDTYGFLYNSAGLDPLNPLMNVLLGDDDSGPGLNFALTYDFKTTGTYYIVVTTLKPTLTGTYSLILTEGGPLPVKLISFTAEKSSSSKNLLKWVSSEEINILKYEVQHSNDGINFKNIGGATIDAHNLATNSFYNYADNTPYQKLNYYRLKIIDKSGSVTFSTVSVTNNSQNITAGVSIFPNPAVNFLNIQTSAGQKGKAAVSIISGAGQIVYKSDYTIASESIINLNVKNLSAGNYVVRIKTANGETTIVPFAKH